MRVNPDRNPDARLLRHSLTEGVCANCAATAFLKGTEPLATVMRGRGPEMLRDERVAAQFAAVMAAGGADARPDEIDWSTVIDQWWLPDDA